MVSRLRFHPTDSDATRYKELLCREFSEDSLTSCLLHIRGQIEGAGCRMVFHWERGKPDTPKAYPIPSAASDYLRTFLERANAAQVEKVPVNLEFPSEKEASRLARLAHQAAVILMFQSRLVTLEGDTGLFRDSQSLLFLLCIHFLLPRLREKRIANHHGYLLNALFAHVNQVWPDHPAHHNFLLSVFYEYLGDRGTSKVMLKSALQNTPPDAHDYLTLAQAYWSLLIEEEKWDEAKTFLLWLSRSVGDQDLPEIQQLFDTTYKLSLVAKQSHWRRRKRA